VATGLTRAYLPDTSWRPLGDGWSTMMVWGIFAGWLIAMMVWMMPAADSSRAFIIVCMTYLVSLGRLPHAVAGSVEVLYLVASKRLAWGAFLGSFLAPTLIGNTIGGVSLVAFFNHAQVVTEESP
jgi:formate-nitrite transporter family protein